MAHRRVFSLSTSSTEIVHRPPHLNLYGEGLVRSLVFRTVNKQKKKTWDRPEFSISISKAQFSDKNLGICTISNIHYHFVLYLIISSKKITKFGLGSVVFFLFLFFSSFYFYQKKKRDFKERKESKTLLFACISREVPMTTA